jgi:phosphatidylinositol-3-phosphatase
MMTRSFIFIVCVIGFFTLVGAPCAPAACVAPAMTAQPSGQAVCPSATSVTFAATASGSPTPTVQWQVSTNGGASFSNVAGATSTQLVVAANNSIPVTGPVFLILMENENWASISGNASAPYINNTVLPMASYATQYYNPPGLHPSEPNYLWLEAGTNFDILDDDDPSVNSQTTTNHLATQLKNAGLSWRGYEESIPGGACPLTNTGPTDSAGDPEYAVRHEPFCFFDDVTCDQNTACAYCIANVVPYTQLAGDLSSNTVARYNFLTPNLCDDMHDTCTPVSNEILQGDTWLSNNLPQILASQAYLNGGVVFITWDEGENGDGPIGMIVLSPVAKGGGYNNAIHYTHSSTLRTVQEILGVGPLLGDAVNATDLSDLFVTGPSLNASQYRALFTNSCGSVTSSVATLSISIPPAISNQPSPQTVCNDQSAQFVVGATGTGPLTYQWRQVGWGAGGWQLSTTGTNGTGGLFIGSSTVNGGGDPDSTGDIDTDHQAWGLYANAGALSQAIRPFNGLMAVGQTFKIAMDNGYLNSATQNGGTIGAGSVGFGLQDAGGTNRFEFYFTGGDSQYRIYDASSASNATGISFTDQGLDLAFTLTGVNTYSVTVNAADSDGPSGLPLTFTGTLTGTAGTSIDQVRLFNYSAGNGQTYDAYFNSISIGAKADNAADPTYGVGWTNGQDGGTVTITNGAEFSGATNATLTISPAGSADAASYNVLVSGGCTPPAVSATASLAVTPGSGCLSLTITSPPNQTYILTNTVAVSGTASAAAGISGVTVNGTPATSANGFTNWTTTVSGLASCTNTLVAVATDNGGNTVTNFSEVIVAIGSADCNGDGLPDAWQLQYFGCVSCVQAAPTADPDHDGFSNLEEFQAGTNPTNALSSPFRITSITRQSNNVLLAWTTAGGTTNVVQATDGIGGSYSTNFANISPLIDVAGSSLTSTNYLDMGGATNVPARYYRVEMLLVPQSQTVTQALDNADDPAYSGGWTNGSNGGTGFSPWTLTGSGVLGSNTNGYFIGSSTNNAFDASPGIDVGGKSWGIYANDTNFTAAYRGFSASVPVGGTLKVDMDNGFINTGFSDGFVLRNGNATNNPAAYNTAARFEFLYLGGDSSNSYKVVDEAGLYNIGVPFTGTGVHLTFTLNTADTYTLLVVDNASGATNATVIGTLSGTTGSTVDSIAVYNRNAGSGSTANAFFNSLQIIAP